MSELSPSETFMWVKWWRGKVHATTWPYPVNGTVLTMCGLDLRVLEPCERGPNPCRRCLKAAGL